MLLQPKLSNKSLAEMCHRLAIETDTGIDIRRTWQRETDITRGRLQPYIASIRDAVARGDTLSDALASTGSVFPPLFLEMARVGEQTGTLAKVFSRLESHYRRQVRAERIFLGAIAWPMFELAFAILIVGALIWILGVIAQRNNGKPIDILGFGLVGTRGLIIYSILVTVVVVCISSVVVAVNRGMLWTRSLQRAMLQIPAIGNALQRIALARIAWALHLTLNVDIGLRRIIPLALRSTANDYYIRHTNQIVNIVTAGEPLHVAFAASHAFPSEFIDALAAAEESGRIVESMERLSNRYEEEAESAIKILAKILGFAVAGCVMAFIVFLIFRLANFYIGTINDAVKMTGRSR
jgi:type II secretory pathway component PulF